MLIIPIGSLITWAFASMAHEVIPLQFKHHVPMLLFASSAYTFGTTYWVIHSHKRAQFRNDSFELKPIDNIKKTDNELNKIE